MKLATVLLIALLLFPAGCRSEHERTILARSSELAGTRAGSVSVPEARARDALALRRLWSGSDFNFFASSPSPDGRYVTDIDWSTGDLVVRDLVTSRMHRLTDKGPWSRSGDYAEVARFSPDGRRIAYGWYKQSSDSYEVRLLDFRVDEDGTPRGSNARIVHPGGPQYAYWLWGWTESDELLTGIYRPDNSTALGFLSLEHGTLRVLKSFEWADPRAALSPDGRFVAYDHPPGEDRHDRDIYLMRVDGSQEVRLTQGSDRDVVLGWVPADGSLLFYREGSGTGQIWRLPMSEGQPIGQPEVLHTGVPGLEPLGFAGDDYYFGQRVDAPLFRKATIDAGGHRLVGETTLLESRATAQVPTAMAWSPDGSFMVHYINEGPARSRFVLSAEDGTPVDEWSTDFRLLRRVFRWTPDGERLLLPAQDHRGRAGLFRMDLASGEAVPFRRFEPGMGRAFSLSPDGRMLYFTRSERVEDESGSGVAAIIARDLLTGSEKAIHHFPYRGSLPGSGNSSPIAVTPAQDRIAFFEIGEDGAAWLRLLSLEGGAVRTLHRVAPPDAPEILGWSPDGSDLYFLLPDRGSTSPGEGKAEQEAGTWSASNQRLWRISATGGDAETTGVIHDYVGGAVLHPDGTTIAYRSGVRRGEIWAIEGLGATTVGDEEDRR